MTRDGFEPEPTDSMSRVLTIAPWRLVAYNAWLLTEAMFSFTTENKFGFISNILTVRNFLNFFLFQIEEKKIPRYICVLIFKFGPFFVGIFQGVT